MNIQRLAARLVLLAFASQAVAEPLQLPREGWVSWEVAAPEDAPAWCCFGSWQDKLPRATCKLDARHTGFGTRDHETTDTFKVYARFAGGKLDRLQALAASCPVETKTPIRELSSIATDDSARWLIAQVKQGGTDAVTREPIAEGALAALSMHRGELASNSLAGFALRDARADNRQWAGFWLSQSGAANAEQVLGESLRKDSDEEVREQAVFALSQLPDERATPALIATAEDRSLPNEQRKQAIFWLSQSESDAALDYLEKLLATRLPD
jgi:hypothetical protein